MKKYFSPIVTIATLLALGLSLPSAAAEGPVRVGLTVDEDPSWVRLAESLGLL